LNTSQILRDSRDERHKGRIWSDVTDYIDAEYAIE